MTTRALDLLDLPILHRYRNEALGFDATRALTRGNPLGTMGWMSYMDPTRHMYAAITDDSNGSSLLGGVYQARGEMCAKLSYLAPASKLDDPALIALLENLAAEAGIWGAFHVVAEVDEDCAAFTSLRAAGFSVYAWQRMWDVSELAGSEASGGWVRANSIHLPGIQSLYQQIVPPLLQPVEQMPRQAGGFICSEDFKCYVSYASGAYGIALHPLIHPEATSVPDKLFALVSRLPNRRNRRVYVCVRSYQAWLENILADLGGSAGPRQAVMVKHLAHLVKDEQALRAAQPAGVSVQASRVSRMESKK
jgi:hypothetical protein